MKRSESKNHQALTKKKQTVRIMNRLLRAGFSSNSIFKLLRSWDVAAPVDEVGRLG